MHTSKACTCQAAFELTRAARTRLPQVLEQVCDVLTGWNLYEIMTNPRASHVARRLLSVAAGRDVSPPSTKKACTLQARMCCAALDS